MLEVRNQIRVGLGALYGGKRCEIVRSRECKAEERLRNLQQAVALSTFGNLLFIAPKQESERIIYTLFHGSLVLLAKAECGRVHSV